MNLPADFTTRMQALLGADYAAFAASYDAPRTQGLRTNSLKLTPAALEERAPFALRPIPWAPEGFYYAAGDRPGKHPYHEAGLYYMQEPSAMAVGELVQPQPGQCILDLCAAPGGKTSHIAAKMGGSGLLVANEIHPARAKILSQNIERMGVRNAVVLNETPDRLARFFPAFFDAIVVDAPCSGEGMFRKDAQAVAEWSPDNVALCAARQDDILEAAEQMLAPGGRIVYSTCTFAPEENEGTLSRFLARHPAFSIEDTPGFYTGFDSGRADWVAHPAAGLEHAHRLFPHKIDGEGHFMAVLRREGPSGDPRLPAPALLRADRLPPDYTAFLADALTAPPAGDHLLFGDQLYLLPAGMRALEGLKVLRPGLHLGTLKKGRFEPAHALALALRSSEARHTLDLSADGPEVLSYLRGNTLTAPEGCKGWVLVTVDGYPLGWGKASGGILKNHYPKGLRWM